MTRKSPDPDTLTSQENEWPRPDSEGTKEPTPAETTTPKSDQAAKKLKLNGHAKANGKRNGQIQKRCDAPQASAP